MNPRKPDEERMRDCMIGVPFPRSRKGEVKRHADANGLSMAAWSRMIILNKLDEIKKQERSEKVV